MNKMRKKGEHRGPAYNEVLDRSSLSFNHIKKSGNSNFEALRNYNSKVRRTKLRSSSVKPLSRMNDLRKDGKEDDKEGIFKKGSKGYKKAQ